MAAREITGIFFEDGPQSMQDESFGAGGYALCDTVDPSRFLIGAFNKTSLVFCNWTITAFATDEEVTK